MNVYRANDGTSRCVMCGERREPGAACPTCQASAAPGSPAALAAAGATPKAAMRAACPAAEPGRGWDPSWRLAAPDPYAAGLAALRARKAVRDLKEGRAPLETRCSTKARGYEPPDPYAADLAALRAARGIAA